MNPWQAAKNVGLRRAFEARRRLSIPREKPLNVFDACDRFGIEVRFIDAKSLEGTYFREPRLLIILPSPRHRPRGRIAFSCGHELGHHEMGHGTRVDKYIAGFTRPKYTDPDELAADVFSAHFLMPRQAVVAAFAKRHWKISAADPPQIYTIAGQFGVGYDALITQFSNGLSLLSRSTATTLAKATPKSLRAQVWADSAASNLLVVDSQWDAVPADLEVSDYLATPHDTRCDSDLLEKVGDTCDHAVWLAKAPGRCKIGSPDGPVAVRIAKADYIGSNRHRFMGEAEL